MDITISELTTMLKEMQKEAHGDLFEVVVEDLLAKEFESVDQVIEYLTDLTELGVGDENVSRLVHIDDVVRLFHEYSENIISTAIGAELSLKDFEEFEHFAYTATCIAYEVECWSLLQFIQEELLTEEMAN